jgi:hypothetical protein
MWLKRVKNLFAWKAIVESLSATNSLFQIPITLDQIVLNTIAAHLTLPVGKLFTLELVNSHFAKALFNAYQQFQCLRIVEHDSPGDGRLAILKRQSFFFHSLHSVQSNLVQSLISIFSRFSQITSVQVSYLQFGLMQQNVNEILETFDKCTVHKIKSMTILLPSTAPFLYNNIPDILHHSLSTLVICNCSRQVMRANILENAMKKLNLHSVELHHFRIKITETDWLVRAFGHMSNLRCLQMDPSLIFPMLTNPKTREVILKLDTLRIAVDKYWDDIDYLNLKYVNNNALEFLNELKCRTKVTFITAISKYSVGGKDYFTNNEFACRIEDALELSRITRASVIVCVSSMNRMDICGSAFKILKRKLCTLEMKETTKRQWCRFQTGDKVAAKFDFSDDRSSYFKWS